VIELDHRDNGLPDLGRARLLERVTVDDVALGIHPLPELTQRPIARVGGRIGSRLEQVSGEGFSSRWPICFGSVGQSLRLEERDELVSGLGLESDRALGEVAGLKAVLPEPDQFREGVRFGHDSSRC
jgi:hypothetical protein